jgi:hypothetical protein
VLRDSEWSSKLNTSFAKRLNLKIRQGSAYLFRRTACLRHVAELVRDGISNLVMDVLLE